MKERETLRPLLEVLSAVPIALVVITLIAFVVGHGDKIDKFFSQVFSWLLPK